MTVWRTQAEADALFAMEKRRVDNQRWRLPDTGGGIGITPVAWCQRGQFRERFVA
jgi:hypothetical protein